MADEENFSLKNQRETKVMIVVINDDRVSNVEAYLPLAKAFAADAAANDKGCHSMEVLADPKIEGRVVYLSHFATKEDFEAHAKGETFAKHVKLLGKYFISASDTILEVKS
jgi:quinol monooxygenase YgiN